MIIHHVTKTTGKKEAFFMKCFRAFANQKEAKYGFPNKRLLLFIEVFEKFCDKISRV